MEPISIQPLVSVVLCSYNGKDFIGEQLASLERQTYKNVAFICSDNNSKDGTAEIIQHWCEGNERCLFISCKEEGLNKNFFNAIAFAKGEYIIFCDQDDVWLDDKIEQLVAYAEQNQNASMVYGLSKQFSGQLFRDTFLKKGINHLEGLNVKKTMLISFTLGHNIIIKRSVLKRIPAPANETVAYDWWITVSAMCIGPIKCFPKVVTYWRQHSTNTTIGINADLFYKSRIAYLQQFLTNDLISESDKEWITKAIDRFSVLKVKDWSSKLFIFLLSNAPTIFFYKTKKNILLKWISFFKWSMRMSKRAYRP